MHRHIHRRRWSVILFVLVVAGCLPTSHETRLGIDRLVPPISTRPNEPTITRRKVVPAAATSFDNETTSNAQLFDDRADVSSSAQPTNERATAKSNAQLSNKRAVVGAPRPLDPIPCPPTAAKRAAGLYLQDRTTAGQVALTFDDGPFRRGTPLILDMLALHHFPATFFVIGRNIDRHSYAVLQRIEREGHLIASHSYNHDVRMARGHNSVGYIRGQHETTRILIELALLARSGDDFDTLYQRVFEHTAGVWLGSATLGDWRSSQARHRQVLNDRGFPNARYQVRYSRPPGGGPYLGSASASAARQRYDRALAQLGMLNVMWHGEAGDVHATRRSEFMFLENNIVRGARRGGVLLIHDYIRHDALSAALAVLHNNGSEVITLDQAIASKYGCTPDSSPASCIAAAMTCTPPNP